MLPEYNHYSINSPEPGLEKFCLHETWNLVPVDAKFVLQIFFNLFNEIIDRNSRIIPLSFILHAKINFLSPG